MIPTLMIFVKMLQSLIVLIFIIAFPPCAVSYAAADKFLPCHSSPGQAKAKIFQPRMAVKRATL
jgi:hypothetical protein